MGTSSNRSAGTQVTKKGITQGTVLVDPVSGNPVDVIKDISGVRRIAVDANITAQIPEVLVDVRYTDGDSVAIGDPNTNTTMKIESDGSINANIIADAATGDNVGLKLENRTLTPSDAQYNQRVTAIQGSVDTNTVSMDTSLHDNLGNAYTFSNPLPVASSFESFFQIIGDSNWMKLASYDSVIPTYSNGGTTLTLAYYEDSSFLGEAIINFTSLTNYNVTLKRYLDEDDGSILQDDDGSSLNLD